MFKYKYNGSLHTDEKGNTYKPSKGVLTVPTEIKALSHMLIKEEVIVDEGFKDWKAEAITLGLEGEDLKKFMGKNKTQRQKQLDKLRG